MSPSQPEGAVPDIAVLEPVVRRVVTAEWPTVVSHPDDFATSVGVDQSEGADEVDRQGIQVEVRYSDVRQW